MPSFKTPDDAQLYFEEAGSGLALITTHGFSETGRYWSASPVALKLQERFRLIHLDMRGHGKTSEAKGFEGYDIECLANDLQLLVDHLSLDGFCLLGHATGSVVALRYAMSNPDGLKATSVTSAASATAMVAETVEENHQFFSKMADFYELHNWSEIERSIRKRPRPFLHGLDANPNKEKLWSQIMGVFKENDPVRLSRFVRAFYVETDPCIAELERIKSPVQVVIAEQDYLMINPSRLIAKNVPDVEVVELNGVGHMTAFEAPVELASSLIQFFSKHETDSRT